MRKIDIDKIKKIRTRRSKNSKYSVDLRFENINWDKLDKIFSSDSKFIKDKLKDKTNQTPNNKEILKLLAGGAFLGLSLFFPALPMVIAPFVSDGNRYKRGPLSQSVKRLKRQKLIEVFDENGETLVKITKEGKLRVLRYKLDELTIEKPKSWDKKWRLVVFDIPEKQKRMREIFRKHLKMLGFYPLQKSVWVHAYPCFDEIEFLRQIYNVGINVSYIVADKIEGNKELEKHFQI